MDSRRRIAEKRIQLAKRRKETGEVEQRCRNILLERLHVNQVQCETFACRERIRLLKLLIQKTKQNIGIAEVKVETLKEANEYRNGRLPGYEEKTRSLKRYVVQMGVDVETRHTSLYLLHDELKNVIKSNVDQLVKYIFPIAQVQSAVRVTSSGKAESSGQSDKSTHEAVVSSGVSDIAGRIERGVRTEYLDVVNALAEATSTAYVRGHWVSTASSGDSQHSIVASRLPDSGDYSAYNLWVATTKNGALEERGFLEAHNPAYDISAALTYTTQLVNILSFYLDVRLPVNLRYSDFCSHELMKPHFVKRVARLNSNVLHLCFSQNVNINLLHPSRTLQNIIHLLDSELGRQGPIEINLLLTKYLEDRLVTELECSEDSRSEDGGTLPYEWETSTKLEEVCSKQYITSDYSTGTIPVYSKESIEYPTGMIESEDMSLTSHYVPRRKRSFLAANSEITQSGMRLHSLPSGTNSVSCWDPCDKCLSCDVTGSDVYSFLRDTTVLRDWNVTNLKMSSSERPNFLPNSFPMVGEPRDETEQKTNTPQDSGQVFSWLQNKVRHFLSAVPSIHFRNGAGSFRDI